MLDRRIFLGLQRDDNRYQWKWLDGRPRNEITPWRKGSPKSIQGPEMCAHWSVLEHGLDDISCDLHLPHFTTRYVCERTKAQHEEMTRSYRLEKLYDVLSTQARLLAFVAAKWDALGNKTGVILSDVNQVLKPKTDTAPITNPIADRKTDPLGQELASEADTVGSGGNPLQPPPLTTGDMEGSSPVEVPVPIDEQTEKKQNEDQEKKRESKEKEEETMEEKKAEEKKEQTQKRNENKEEIVKITDAGDGEPKE